MDIDEYARALGITVTTTMWRPSWTQVARVAGDGNCFWRAAAVHEHGSQSCWQETKTRVLSKGWRVAKRKLKAAHVTKHQIELLQQQVRMMTVKGAWTSHWPGRTNAQSQGGVTADQFLELRDTVTMMMSQIRCRLPDEGRAGVNYPSHSEPPLLCLLGGGWKHNICRRHNSSVLALPQEVPHRDSWIEGNEWKCGGGQLKMVVANVVSLRKHIESLILLDADLSLVSEVQLTNAQASSPAHHLRARGLQMLWAVPHTDAEVAKLGGVAILLKSHLRAVELLEPEYGKLWRWRQQGRALVTKILDHQSRCIGVAVALYWNVAWQANSQSQQEAAWFWGSLTEFAVSWASTPLWIGGDANTVEGEIAEFDFMSRTGYMLDVVEAFEGAPRKPTTHRQAGAIDYLWCNRKSMSVEACTAEMSVFPNHLHLQASSSSKMRYLAFSLTCLSRSRLTHI